MEALVRLYDRFVGLDWWQGLIELAEKGIKGREEKGKKVGGRKGEAGQEGGVGDREALKASGVRLKTMIAMAKEK